MLPALSSIIQVDDNWRYVQLDQVVYPAVIPGVETVECNATAAGHLEDTPRGVVVFEGKLGGDRTGRKSFELMAGDRRILVWPDARPPPTSAFIANSGTPFILVIISQDSSHSHTTLTGWQRTPVIAVSPETFTILRATVETPFTVDSNALPPVYLRVVASGLSTSSVSIVVSTRVHRSSYDALSSETAPLVFGLTAQLRGGDPGNESIYASAGVPSPFVLRSSRAPRPDDTPQDFVLSQKHFSHLETAIDSGSAGNVSHFIFVRDFGRIRILLQNHFLSYDILVAPLGKVAYRTFLRTRRRTGSAPHEEPTRKEAQTAIDRCLRYGVQEEAERQEGEGKAEQERNDGADPASIITRCVASEKCVPFVNDIIAAICGRGGGQWPTYIVGAGATLLRGLSTQFSLVALIPLAAVQPLRNIIEDRSPNHISFRRLTSLAPELTHLLQQSLLLVINEEVRTSVCGFVAGICDLLQEWDDCSIEPPPFDPMPQSTDRLDTDACAYRFTPSGARGRVARRYATNDLPAAAEKVCTKVFEAKVNRTGGLFRSQLNLLGVLNIGRFSNTLLLLCSYFCLDHQICLGTAMIPVCCCLFV